MRNKGVVAWTAIDFLTALILVIFVLIAPPHRNPPAILTQGAYAVTLDWPGAQTDDIDLWVQDPAGNICYFDNPNTGLMNLEHDDIGSEITESLTWQNHTYKSQGGNHERTVIRQTIPGEYTVNVMFYRKDYDGPVPVTITLWFLKDAQVITQKKLTLTTEEQNITAFRFTVNRAGSVRSINHLPKDLGSLANASGT